jgi:hypothetical protein
MRSVAAFAVPGVRRLFGTTTFDRFDLTRTVYAVESGKDPVRGFTRCRVTPHAEAMRTFEQMALSEVAFSAADAPRNVLHFALNGGPAPTRQIGPHSRGMAISTDALPVV